MTLDWCFEKGLLKKSVMGKDAVDSEVLMAEKNLKEAGDLLALEKYNASLIYSYTSAFHSARALLYRDGYKERSHACIVEYLYENYVGKGLLEERFVSKLNYLRRERHETFYGMAPDSTAEEAGEYVDFARDFLSKVKVLLKK